MGRKRVGMAQHALGREDDERLAPGAQRLAAQQVEILRGGRGLADLDVVARGELQVALDAGAGVLRALAFVAVRQQQHEAAEQAPLVFAGGDELIDDDLRAVGEVAELRFPQHQGFRVVAAVAVLEAEHAGFGEDRVVDAEARLVRGEVVQRNPALLVFDVDEDAVALVEGAALRVLAAEAHRRAGEQQRAEGDGFGHAVIEGLLAAAHGGALLEQLFDLGMDVKAVGIRGESCRRSTRIAVAVEAGVDFEIGLLAAAVVAAPVVGHLDEDRLFARPWWLSSALRRIRSGVP